MIVFPVSISLICLSISYWIAFSTNLNEFTFLVSVLVPKSFESIFLTETFASHLIEPSAIFPSEISRYLIMECIDFKYATASSGELISGSDTISIKGVPALFKSIPDWPSKSSWRDFPASSSRWALVIPILLLDPSSNSISKNPSSTMGLSIWLIW